MTFDMDFLAFLVLVLGIVLLFIEIFIPNFGIVGGIGILAIITGIVMTADSVLEGVLMFLGIAGILSIVILLLWKFVLRKSRSGIILNDVVDNEVKSQEDIDYLLQKQGIAITPLRPSGIANFDGVRLDVITEGDFIPRDSSIIITEIRGNKIVVKKVSENIN